MNREKVFAWIESLEDMANQSDKYFVERNKLYTQNQEKDKEIERLSKEVDMWNKKYNEQIDIINELEKDIQKEIDRTNDLILEDGSLGEITTIRKMLNDTRQCILFRIKKLKEGK